MQQWTIVNDKVFSLGEVPYLGVPYDKIKSGEVNTLPEDYDGWFPFMRMSYSVGDLGITSGIFEALKTKYPNIKIAWPSTNYIKNVLGESFISQWDYNENMTAVDNIMTIMDGNPYIDKIFEIGEFDRVFCDHDRSYLKLINDGERITTAPEPLAEQILRRFGFDDNDISHIDSLPKIYFSKEEADICNSILKKYVGDDKYGCILLASRLDAYKRVWDGEEYLFDYLNDYSGMPVFYYSDRDLSNSKWSELFPNMIDFRTLGLTIRQQIYIKRNAEFNVGYQAGITDTSSVKGGNTIVLTPYKSIKSNCIRGTRYIHTNGNSYII